MENRGNDVVGYIFIGLLVLTYVLFILGDPSSRKCKDPDCERDHDPYY